MNWDTISSYGEERPEKVADREAKRQLARKRAFIRWNLVFSDPATGRQIYHLQYKRFSYCDYPKSIEARKLVSVFIKPTSLSIQIVQKERATTRIIFSFKKGKLGVFRILGKAIKRVSPLNLISSMNNPSLQGVRFNESKPEEHVGWIRNEKRLIKLFAKLARANKVKLPDLSKYITLIDVVVATYYPVHRELTDYGISVNLPEFTHSVVAPHLRQPTFKAFLKSLAGYDSKALTKMVLADKVMTGDVARRWAILNILKGLIPLDYQYRVMQSQWLPTFRPTEPRADIRRFLKHYSAQTIIQWICLSQAHGNRYFADMVSMFKTIREIKPDYVAPKSTKIEEVHDELAREQRKMQRVDRPIKQPKELLDLKMEGSKLSGYTLVLPKTTHELMNWGDQMSNCIGGYVNQIERGYSWILGCEKNGRIHYGIELSPNEYEPLARVRQFKGVRNVDAPEEMKNALVEILVAKSPVRAEPALLTV